MRIAVRHEGYEVHLIDDEWRCPHNDIEVQAPCCTGSGLIECGCQGRYSVFCHDCQNDDLRDYEAHEIIENYLANEGDDYDRYE